MVKKIVVLTGLLAMGCSAVYADGAQTGLTLGGQIGMARAQAAPDAKFGFAGGVFVGYDFALSPKFSLGTELGAQYATKIAEGNFGYKVKTMSVPLFLTAKYYATQEINVFGKLGYAYNKLKVDHVFGSASKTLWRPVAAFGAGYDVTDNINVFAQYQYNWFKQGNIKPAQSTYSLGLSYKLPMGGSHVNNNVVATPVAQPVDNTPVQPVVHHTDYYTVVKGDTLYGIAGQKGMSNKMKFAHCVTEQNAHVENKHWIYPGEKLNLSGC